MTHSQTSPNKFGGFSRKSLNLNHSVEPKVLMWDSLNETPSTSNHEPLGDCYGKKICTFQWNKTQLESKDCNSEERTSLQTQHQLSHHLDTKVQETYT